MLSGAKTPGTAAYQCETMKTIAGQCFAALPMVVDRCNMIFRWETARNPMETIENHGFGCSFTIGFPIGTLGTLPKNEKLGTMNKLILGLLAGCGTFPGG